MQCELLMELLLIMQTIEKWRFHAARIARYGLTGIASRIAKKSLLLFLAILFLPITLVLFFLGFRRLTIFSERIGHLAIEPDTLLKAQMLGLIQPKRWIWLAPKKIISNEHLLKYWQQYFTITRSEPACFFLHALTLWPFMRYNVSHFINRDNHAQFSYRVNTLWGQRPQLLQLTAEDIEWGNQQLIQLGLPKDAWFVCVHAREPGFSPIDESLHSHRNGKIENVQLAIEEITRRGGWVVRIGDPTMTALQKMPQVIDYVHHPLRNARMDIILCARARFILGNTSGIFIVASVFGVPSALANMIPMSTLGFITNDLSIPKMYWLVKQKRYFTFAEIMMSPISNFRTASMYKNNDYVVEENSAEDILLLTTEMLDRLEGKFLETEDDLKLQEKYMSLFQPQHYSYDAASKVSTNFLRKYRYLLEVESVKEKVVGEN